ncbi:hypothetical protein CANCADRAFT_2499 [Tortispora caseinolytica NRRL Y-17796]|uniref:Nas2 N-terminal domain-containing protein n=1 Tax=Tortispora caseinolytica NRRL Y-17796 TaxID=767744 RepID=A0A1E4TGE3_9ASCO|nr:hypothetical protein CANCADRAFT_2499 [Tortispora caseinolytica NRRL Y-17796]
MEEVTETFPVAESDRTETLLELQRLDMLRIEYETLLDRLSDQLTAQGVSFDTPVLTEDGFPRADINVAEIRHIRTQIIRTRNDINGITSKIGALLLEHFDEIRTRKSDKDDNLKSIDVVKHKEEPGNRGDEKTEDLIPFAIIDAIEDKGPAEKAKLRVGDKILAFGPVKTGRRNIREAVIDISKQDEIPIIVRQQQDSSEVTFYTVLRPENNWGGKDNKMKLCTIFATVAALAKFGVNADFIDEDEPDMQWVDTSAQQFEIDTGLKIRGRWPLFDPELDSNLVYRNKRLDVAYEVTNKGDEPAYLRLVTGTFYTVNELGYPIPVFNLTEGEFQDLIIEVNGSLKYNHRVLTDLPVGRYVLDMAAHFRIGDIVVKESEYQGSIFVDDAPPPIYHPLVLLAYLLSIGSVVGLFYLISFILKDPKKKSNKSKSSKKSKNA